MAAGKVSFGKPGKAEDSEGEIFLPLVAIDGEKEGGGGGEDGKGVGLLAGLVKYGGAQGGVKDARLHFTQSFEG